MKSIITMFAMAAAAFLTGCASNPSFVTSPAGTSTAYRQAQRAEQVQIGKVISVRTIEMIDQPAAMGQKIGGTIGAVVGLLLGKELSEKVALQATTAGLGGMLGAEYGKQKTGRILGQEIVIQLESTSRWQNNGKTIAVAQSSADGTIFRRGQKVMLIGNGRVAPLQ